ncbi:MAG: undecaprenyl-diphosphate phosphatase [Alkalibacterium sp.]|nr:undecaprenyl-diphosphate phosphatase [Alkalibacterium sp.]
MILVDEFLVLNTSDAFKEMFLVVIQLASILAVILLFFKKLNPFDGDKSDNQKKETWHIWFKVVVGVLPAAVFGLLFEDTINEVFFNWQTVSVALIVYGIAFIIIEKRNEGRVPKVATWEQLSYKVALMIGFFQVLALIPGTSRSGATIVGAILIGTARPIAAEYSFLPVHPSHARCKLAQTGRVRIQLYALQNSLFYWSAACFLSSFRFWQIKFLMNYIRRRGFS